MEDETPTKSLKAIITIGIPCSGKSTWAEDFCEEEDYVEINRDNLRMEMFELGHYDDYKFSKGNEQKVTEAAEAAITVCVATNRNVVVSDTNLNKGRREALERRLDALGYEVSYKVFDIEFFDALKRNDKRSDKHIPRSAMYSMYRSFMTYKEEQGEWTKHVNDNNLPSAYIVDIDGTIATNTGSRGFYDWDKVGLDGPIQTTIDVVKTLFDGGHYVILLTGRDERSKQETEKWLYEYDVPYHAMYMRPEGSMEKDRYVKHKLFIDHVASKHSIKGVFDDRPQVCLLWHDLGLPVFKVGDPIIEF